VSEDARLRLFVAIELPAAVRDTLVGWRTEALRGLDGVRPVAPEHLHLTLCFLGWQESTSVDAISAACAAAAAASESPAELEAGAAVWLPPRRPRVLALDLTDASGQVATLQAALSAKLESGGWYEPEKRPFRPHVTVARVSRGTRSPRGRLPPVPPTRFSASELTLYRSRLSPAGARYEALARFG
jgi:RNA 2',3'-cyclic 3'-phosphodiesterase